ncbi:MAG TPA: hypothetical protein VMV54_03645, partial [Acidocella sp.]|nr:hypothetical protein [Acidocella sp.]
ELPRPGSAGHLALNFAIIEWLQGLGHEIVILLVGARLAVPVERYGLAPVAGPRIKGFGDYVVAGSPHAAAGVLARAAIRHLPASLSARIRGARHRAYTVLGGFASKADSVWCARYIARTRPDAVIIDTIFRAGLLAEPEMRAVNSMIVAHDVFHRRHLALTSAGYSVQPRRLSREDEAAWLCGGGISPPFSPRKHASSPRCAQCRTSSWRRCRPSPARRRRAPRACPTGWFLSAARRCRISTGCAGSWAPSGHAWQIAASRST